MLGQAKTYWRCEREETRLKQNFTSIFCVLSIDCSFERASLAFRSCTELPLVAVWRTACNSTAAFRCFLCSFAALISGQPLISFIDRCLSSTALSADSRGSNPSRPQTSSFAFRARRKAWLFFISFSTPLNVLYVSCRSRPGRLIIFTELKVLLASLPSK